MSDGVTIIMTMDVKPEIVDGLAAGFPEMIKDTAQRPGFRNIKIVRNGNKLNLIEEWDSEADYDAYIAWRTERGDMDAMGAMLNGVTKEVWPTLIVRA
ncbi:MAG: antibiotic biosynthesis monooxygenase [Caulobacteraceae bacterium]|nr:MAG: antibiotic biosynthesis monooxygenase [Caulobacteraceae bacterium]